MGTKRRLLKLGDVYAIPLPNGKYAFGRTFRDAGFAIYRHIGETLEDVPVQEDYQFFVGIYKYVLKSGQWPVVDHRPFDNDEESWPPPTCIIDPLNGQVRSKYHKGQITPSTREECIGLETASVWDDQQLIDRIMGDTKWIMRCT